MDGVGEGVAGLVLDDDDLGVVEAIHPVGVAGAGEEEEGSEGGGEEGSDGWEEEEDERYPQEDEDGVDLMALPGPVRVERELRFALDLLLQDAEEVRMGVLQVRGCVWRGGVCFFWNRGRVCVCIYGCIYVCIHVCIGRDGQTHTVDRLRLIQTPHKHPKTNTEPRQVPRAPLPLIQGSLPPPALRRRGAHGAQPVAPPGDACGWVGVFVFVLCGCCACVSVGGTRTYIYIHIYVACRHHQ